MAKTKKRKLKRYQRIMIIFALVIAGILAGTAAFAYFLTQGENLPLPLPGSNEEEWNKKINVLLIGTDKRSGQNSYNSDTIIVASFDPQTKIISLLSIPRDTRVTLPGSKTFHKINAIPMLKGIPELKKQVTELTGIKLDGHVLTNFSGFKDIIDTLGGITIDVEKDMKHETGDKEDGYINLKAGVQDLDGSKALQYARYRDKTTADIGRTARQQKVLTAVGKKMLEPATILKLPTLIPQIMKAVETDLNLKDMLKLAGAAKSFSDATMVTQTLPGYAIMLDGLSYWEVNRETAKEVARNLLLGQTTDEIWDKTVLSSLDPEVKAHMATQKTEEMIDISEISETIAPKAGAVPVTTVHTEQYSGTIVWSPRDNPFVAGKEYTATITIVPKSGYTLKGIAADFFTVDGATTHNAAGSGVVTAAFPALPAGPTNPTDPTNPTNPTNPTDPDDPEEPVETALAVSLAEIAGLTPPQAGAMPVTTIRETQQYTGTVVWMPAGKPFAEDREYMATITLVPKAGYTLKGVSRNYFVVPGATATNAAGSGVITAVFPPTGSLPAQSTDPVEEP